MIKYLKINKYYKKINENLTYNSLQLEYKIKKYEDRIDI